MGSFDINALATEAGETVIWLSRYVAQPWTVYQLLIVAGCFALAYLLSLRIEPVLEERARKIKGNPRLLRVISAFMRRTEWVLLDRKSVV